MVFDFGEILKKVGIVCEEEGCKVSYDLSDVYEATWLEVSEGERVRERGNACDCIIIFRDVNHNPIKVIVIEMKNIKLETIEKMGIVKISDFLRVFKIIEKIGNCIEVVEQAKSLEVVIAIPTEVKEYFRRLYTPSKSLESPLKRASETLEIISSFFDLKEDGFKIELLKSFKKRFPISDVILYGAC